jgi:hypothetical protein
MCDLSTYILPVFFASQSSISPMKIALNHEIFSFFSSEFRKFRVPTRGASRPLSGFDLGMGMHREMLMKTMKKSRSEGPVDPQD